MAHLYGYEYVKYQYISEQDFRDYYKFAIFRDPIDRIISELNYRKIKRGFFGARSVRDYIEKTLKKAPADSDAVRHIQPQVNYVFDESKSKLIVDKIIKFKDIKAQFEAVKAGIGNQNLKLPHHNSSEQREWKRPELSEKDISFLKDFYAEDYRFLSGLD